MILVDADGIAASRPGKPLFAGLSVTVASGDRLAVVGINGCGKSTLLRMLAGHVEPEQGIVRRGRGARVVALDQEADLPAGTVRSAVGAGWQAEAVLDRLGMAGSLDEDLGRLSGGQAKRVALGRALVAVGEDHENDLLVLDEPTNHLDLDAIAWLEDRLAAFRGGLVLVTHDRHVLDRVTTRILELDRGAGHVHDGGYASYLEARAERAEREQAAERTRRNLARQELAWLRRGARARSRKPKAHLAAAHAVIDGRPPEPARADELPLAELVRMPRLGDTVVELHGVTDGYGERTLLHDVDLALSPGERLGVVGVNGSGKTTLLEILAGRRTPREGRVVRGSTVRVGLYRQAGAPLDQWAQEVSLDQRVRDAVAGPARQPDWSDAALLDRLWFHDDAQWAPIRLLSGGERRRLQLVLVLRQAPNVLLLDEPTNDLDLDTLRALEDMLETWPGALVVVSHDRAFLERTVTDVVVLDGTGHAGRVPGGYAAYEEQLRAARRRGRAASVTGLGQGAAGPARAATAGSRGATPSASHAGGDGLRRRSPSTLRHRMRRVEGEMQRLQQREAELEAELAAAGDDHVALARLGEQLAGVGRELAEVEETWLALAEELDHA